MARANEWDILKRKALKGLLTEGYRIGEIKTIMHVSYPTLQKEFKRGLSEEDYKNLRYIKYSPYLALENTAIEALGKEEFDLLMQYEINKKKGDEDAK